MEFCRKVLFSLCRSPMKEACAEFIGTFFLVLCGDGVMASITLGRLGQHAALVSAFGWGLALGIGIWISGNVSGGHLNPAVTTALAVFKKCSWKKVLPYFIAQYLASFVAAAVVYLVYGDGIAEFDFGMRQLPPSKNATAQIFATYPQESATTGTLFADQVLGTALLLLVISAATDPRMERASTHLPPLIISLGLVTIALAFGHNCGAPLNPARDLGPRLFTAIAGWGTATFSFRNYQWFWIPIVAPHVGALLGVGLYDFFIDMPYRNYSMLEEVEAFKSEISTLEKVTSETSKLPMLSGFGSLSSSEKSSDGSKIPVRKSSASREEILNEGFLASKAGSAN